MQKSSPTPVSPQPRIRAKVLISLVIFLSQQQHAQEFFIILLQFKKIVGLSNSHLKYLSLISVFEKLNTDRF